MKLKYVGRYGGIDVDGIGTVGRGDIVDVPDELAGELVRREPPEWEAAGDRVVKKKEGR